MKNQLMQRELRSRPITPKLRTIDRVHLQSANYFASSAPVLLAGHGQLQWLGPKRADWAPALHICLSARDSVVHVFLESSELLFGEQLISSIPLPGDALAFLAEAHLAPLLNALDHIFGEKFSVASATTSAHGALALNQSANQQIAFVVEDQSRASVLHGMVSTDARVLERAVLEHHPAKDLRNAIANLPFIAHITLGYTWLSAAQARALSVGDWVRADNLPCAAGCPEITARWLMSRSSTMLWQCRRISESQIEVMRKIDKHQFKHFANMKESTMQPITDALPEASLRALSDNAIELCVHFEVGRKTMPLSDLNALTEGQVLSLDHGLQESPVRLMVNDREIARGELVMVGDTLGVCIEKLAA